MLFCESQHQVTVLSTKGKENFNILINWPLFDVLNKLQL